MEEMEKYSGGPVEIVQAQTKGAESMMQTAITAGASIEVIEKLADLWNKERDYQKSVEYDKAMSRVQALIPAIIADAKNEQTHSRYAKTGTLNKVLKPIYTADGFHVDFNEEDSPVDGMVRYMAHCSRDGYSRAYRVDLPPDKAGIKGSVNKTMIHAIKSSGTYAQGILLRRIFNIADVLSDDDGNGGRVAVISREQAEYLKAQIKLAGDQMPESRVKKMFDYAGCDKLAEIPTAKYEDCKRTVESARADKEGEEDLPI